MPTDSKEPVPGASPDRNQDEHKGLSSDEIKTYKRTKEAFEDSKDFVKPYFDKFLRFLKLYRGVLPDALSATYSQLMINIPFSIVQNELPRSLGRVVGEKQFFVLEPHDPLLEIESEGATSWLHYQAQTRNRLYPRALGAFTSTHVFGTGYRVISHAYIPRHTQGNAEPFLDISGENVPIWNIWPARNGGLVNSLDNSAQGCAEWIHWITYKSEDWLKANARKAGFKQDQIAKMLRSTPDSRQDKDAIDLEYTEEDNLTQNDGNVENDALPIEYNRENRNNSMKRWRCVWTFFRNRWVLVGEGKYLIYEAPPQLDWIPLAKYVDTPDFDNWYGIGMLEMVEDVILAFLMNYGFRFDYLSQVFHPSKYIRDDIANANPGCDFDPSPDATYRFPKNVRNIAEAIWYDRFPEISQQTFIEDTGLRTLLQEITAQPNYSKGMGGAGTLANETATGIVSLIEEGTARSTMRSLNMESIGLHDELMLYLKYAEKYVWNDQRIRVNQPNKAVPWANIRQESLTDQYGIELQGTKQLVHKTEAMQQMVSLLPMLIGNPAVPGQQELIRQTLDATDAYTNVDKIVGPTQEAPLLPPAGPTPGGGGAGGQPTLQNEAQAIAGRTGAPASPQFAV